MKLHFLGGALVDRLVRVQQGLTKIGKNGGYFVLYGGPPSAFLTQFRKAAVENDGIVGVHVTAPVTVVDNPGSLAYMRLSVIPALNVMVTDQHRIDPSPWAYDLRLKLAADGEDAWDWLTVIPAKPGIVGYTKFQRQATVHVALADGADPTA